MNKTPKGLRLHIGIFGRRNVGKSSILNALLKQQVAIVSEIAGTTTDPVEKVMELKPIGPVVFIDTAGIDDTGSLGKSRIAKTLKVVDRTELAIIVSDEWTEYEDQISGILEKQSIPFVVAANKSDLRPDDCLEQMAKGSGAKAVVTASALKGTGIDKLRTEVCNAAPRDPTGAVPMISDLISEHELVMLVMPIDAEAPQGRLKMLQVNCMREILDKNAIFMGIKETELARALAGLQSVPDLIVCDSNVLDQVIAAIGPEVKVTTFSILMSRFKGDFEELIRGAEAIDFLEAGDKVLIAEACTHHPFDDDIGRVQIPNLLKRESNAGIQVEICAGRDFPEKLEDYKLIIHCGACVFNRQEMLSRITRAKAAGVSITNYGLTFAHLHGVLERTLLPFKTKVSVAG
ncbi:MAG: [FeFe] hydrogenase H-cluster maturation GTPase HydF [Planctomycetes bacterium]|nr:[FeFe] hydrogenase H-cluster maturation GTPase HydF [Planctomycetota bacterium]